MLLFPDYHFLGSHVGNVRQSRVPFYIHLIKALLTDSPYYQGHRNIKDKGGAGAYVFGGLRAIGMTDRNVKGVVIILGEYGRAEQ